MRDYDRAFQRTANALGKAERERDALAEALRFIRSKAVILVPDEGTARDVYQAADEALAALQKEEDE